MLRSQYSIFRRLNRQTFFKKTHKMISTEKLCEDAENVFKCSVQAVRPEELIRNAVCVQSSTVEIKGRIFPIDKNVHVVGFGKAVMGMALAMEKLLQDHLVSGILSLPVGMQSCGKFDSKDKSLSRMQIFEGAQNNIPDNDSLLAAQKITELVTSLGNSSLLFVLISGGGSALLPSPKFPLTLEEKQRVIKTLVSSGATIEEVNVIRKRLSLLKGGGLAKLAKPAQVISLILSDVIGDPLGLIASGPTVENTDDPSLPLSIIEKYNVKDMLPQTAIKLLEDISNNFKPNSKNFDHVSNFIIGNNTIALQAAADEAKKLKYKPIIMTNNMYGIASDVGCQIIQLVDAAFREDNEKVMQLCEKLNTVNEKASDLLHESKALKTNFKDLCLLFGGETTVKVKGIGKGGRNQELALAASLELYNKNLKNTVVLSAGTDGIDGPTDAAGAIATPFIVGNAKSKDLDSVRFLNCNDSYNFYHSLNNGRYHVKIGHTGTNVMDIIIVLIKMNNQ